MKKGTKKLLPLATGTASALLNRKLDAMNKSFLLLFFKKEDLPYCFSTLGSTIRAARMEIS